jgi:hypothetical protein
VVDVHLVPMLDVPTGLMPLWCLAREHVLYSQADEAYNGFSHCYKVCGSVLGYVCVAEQQCLGSCVATGPCVISLQCGG